MPLYVLILAPKTDAHAGAVAREILNMSQVVPVILDTAAYPQSTALSHSFSRPKSPDWVLKTSGIEIHAHQLTGVWWRRPKTHRIADHVDDQKVRKFCLDECKAAFLGWLNGLNPVVINHPAAEIAADDKSLQLLRATEAGLRVPATCITNDATEARNFAADIKRDTIFKILTNTPWQVTETRLLEEGHLSQLESLRLAPAIFQEFIPSKLDIRVTIIDDKIFASAILPKHPGALLDWRLDSAAEIRPHQLPDDVEAMLFKLVQSLGLRFGAIDLRLTPSGEYYFFEINPGGQFLFCEIHSGQPISKALADSLTATPPSRP